MTRGPVVMAQTLASAHTSHPSSNRAPDCRPKHIRETDASTGQQFWCDRQTNHFFRGAVLRQWRLDSTGSRQRPMAYFCKRKEEASGSKKGEAISKNGVKYQFWYRTVACHKISTATQIYKEQNWALLVINPPPCRRMSGALLDVRLDSPCHVRFPLSLRERLRLDVRLVSPCHARFPLSLRERLRL
jgi:hypothetical protein